MHGRGQCLYLWEEWRQQELQTNETDGKHRPLSSELQFFQWIVLFQLVIIKAELDIEFEQALQNLGKEEEGKQDPDEQSHLDQFNLFLLHLAKQLSQRQKEEQSANEKHQQAKQSLTTCRRNLN